MASPSKVTQMNHKRLQGEGLPAPIYGPTSCEARGLTGPLLCEHLPSDGPRVELASGTVLCVLGQCAALSGPSLPMDQVQGQT